MKKDKQKKYIHKIMNLKYESIIVTVSMVFIYLAFLFTGKYQISQDLQRTIVYGRHDGAMINIHKLMNVDIPGESIMRKKIICDKLIQLVKKSLCSPSRTGFYQSDVRELKKAALKEKKG